MSVEITKFFADVSEDLQCPTHITLNAMGGLAQLLPKTISVGSELDTLLLLAGIRQLVAYLHKHKTSVAEDAPTAENVRDVYFVEVDQSSDDSARFYVELR